MQNLVSQRFHLLHLYPGKELLISISVMELSTNRAYIGFDARTMS